MDGTNTYSPGGSEYLQLISLSLVKEFVIAVAFVVSKNRLSKRSLVSRKSSGTYSIKEEIKKKIALNTHFRCSVSTLPGRGRATVGMKHGL